MSLSDKIRSLKGLTNIHRPGDKPDILIMSTPRSGSTLLLEMFMSQPGMKCCDEPLDLRRSFVPAASQFSEWHDLLPHPEREQKLHNYFTRIRQNRIPFLNVNPANKNWRPFSDRIVFKILHGGEDLFEWFVKSLNVKIVYLLRHPIAVSLSREEFPRLQSLSQHQQRRSALSIVQKKMADKIADSGSKLERGVLCWCLTNMLALQDRKIPGCLTVTYEELVLNPQPCIDHLALHFDLDAPERMWDVVGSPSGTVRKSDGETQAYFKNASCSNKAWLVEKWKKRVSKDELNRAITILDAFEIDVYPKCQPLPHAKYLLTQALTLDTATASENIALEKN